MILTKNGNIVYSDSRLSNKCFHFFLPFCAGLASEFAASDNYVLQKNDNKISIWVSKNLMLIPTQYTLEKISTEVATKSC